MATSGSFETSWQSNYWSSSSNIKYYHWTGNWSRSGNTITLSGLRLWLTFTYNSSGSGTDSVTVTGGSAQNVTFTAAGLASNIVSLNNTSFAVSSGATSTRIYCYIAGEVTGSVQINFDGAPTGLSATNLQASQESFTADVAVTAWNGGTSENRYKELQCWTYNASSLVAPRRYQAVFTDDLSSTITVSNNSAGDLTIVGNTRYTLGLYASNGSISTGSQRYTNAVTLAYKATLSLNSAGVDNLVIDYSVPSDGGFYNKSLEYSIDGGSTWVNFATIQGGSSTSGNFTISGLNAGTEYTVQSRVVTSAGATTNDNLVASTIGPIPPTITTTLVSYNSIDVSYGTTSFSGGQNGKVELEEGTGGMSDPFTLVDTIYSVGQDIYTKENADTNDNVIYRARSYAEFNGIGVWSDYVYSSIVTGCATPEITSGGVTEYETAITVKVTLAVSVLGDENYYNKQIQLRYSYDGGSTFVSDWTTYETVTTGAPVSLSFNFSGMPVSTEILYQIRTATDAYTTNSSSYTVNTSGQHQGPTGFDYSLIEGSASVNGWRTSAGVSGDYFIAGLSEMKISVPQSTAGVCSDGATLVGYSAINTYTSDSVNWNYSSADPMLNSFGVGTPSSANENYARHIQGINVNVTDSLNTSSTVSKNVYVLAYNNPVLNVTAERTPNNHVTVNYTGSFAKLAYNSDDNWTNDITLEYRLIRADGQIGQWTEIENPSVSSDPDRAAFALLNGTISTEEISYAYSYTLEVKLTDTFNTVQASVPLEIWQASKIIHPPAYDIELWDWKTNTFVADISYLVVGDLNIEWELNDVEEVSFSVDLQEFENKCSEMGVTSSELLKPYTHDIRIRRNGEYILGCQLVETSINLTNNPPAKISIKGTGFLNLFKDQYILREAWSGYTYSQIAQKLIMSAQSSDCLVKNPTCDIDTSYWLAASGILSSSTSAHSGARCILGSASSGNPVTFGTQIDAKSGEEVGIDVWVRGTSGDTLTIFERRLITQSVGQVQIGSITFNGDWQEFTLENYKLFSEDSYIVFNSSAPFYVDECYVYAMNDNSTLCDMNVSLGVDTATSVQEATREVNYELQNVKDALMALTNMESDNFDFEFLPDRTFNIYEQKGTEKLGLEVAYPGNVESMTITRSAANLANKIIGIGSGIGDERLQTELVNNPSRRIYGTHESVVTESNMSLESTLINLNVGTLFDKKDPTNVPKVTISDGSVNPSNIETGDIIHIEANGSDYIESVTGDYRVQKISLSVSENAVEKMVLTVDPPIKRPTKKKIRYIRDVIGGSNENAGNYWVEIEALMMVGNEYVNVAAGILPTCSNNAATNLERITDGSLDTASYAGVPVGSGTSHDAVTIDLGDEYPIDYIQVWHYYGDNRVFNNNTLSVGTELVGGATSNDNLEEVLWEYSGAAYAETSNGRKSEWLQEESIVEGE